jgi:hypothetical protein
MVLTPKNCRREGSEPMIVRHAVEYCRTKRQYWYLSHIMMVLCFKCDFWIDTSMIGWLAREIIHRNIHINIPKSYG